MKHLSRLDIEAIAEKYITAYMELPEVQDMQIYRIEPELFLERVLGLKIRDIPARKNGRSSASCPKRNCLRSTPMLSAGTHLVCCSRSSRAK